MDFTINTYKKLLDSLIKAGYTFQTFADFLKKPGKRVILLRHDVDAKKMNSLHFAEIQHGLGIKGTYYFRMVPQSYDPDVIRKIAEMGHEIGYHYEDMDFALRQQRAESMEHRAIDERQIVDQAIKIFEKNLKILRELYPVKTICMHGSPRSRFDNKALWKKYDYRDNGIIGEPYFDIDFNEVFYLTDTGRMWDGDKVSIRDKVSIKTKNTLHDPDSTPGNPESAMHNSFPSFHLTKEIIHAAHNMRLPNKMMLTFHPQRWTNKPLPWLWELIFQNAKNQVKRKMVLKNKS